MSAEFVDSNILVYAHDPTTPAARTRPIARRASLGREDGPAQYSGDAGVFLDRHPEDPVTPATRNRLAVLADLSLWPTYSPVATDVMPAGRLAGEVKISFWDAMLLVAAKASKAKRFWSEDLAHGQIVEGVQIFNPFLES